jgi:hypothetical protein
MNYKEDKIKELKAKQLKKELNKSLLELNQIKNKVSKEWGKQRILQLISPELLMRFKRAEAKYLNAYLTHNKIELNNMMIRAYEALIKDAKDLGYNKLSPEFILSNHPVTNKQIIICVNEDDMPIAYERYKSKEDVIIFYIDELLIAIDQTIFNAKRATYKLRGQIKKYESIS